MRMLTSQAIGECVAWLFSGTWFLAVATQGGDGITQLLRSLQVSPGECHCQGEFQFLELMFTLAGAAGHAAAAGDRWLA